MKLFTSTTHIYLRIVSLLSIILLLIACDADTEVDRSLEEIVGEQPTINSFSPQSTPLLGNVTVEGSALNFVEKAFINGIETPIHQRVNSTQLIIEAGKEVTSGPIKLITGAGKEVISENDLTITYPTPVVNSEVPTSSLVNEDIILEGENLDAVTKVTFGEVEGPIQFQEEGSLVVRTPLNNNSPMDVSIHFNNEAGEQSTLIQTNYQIIIPAPAITAPPRLMLRDKLVSVLGENINLITSIEIEGQNVPMEEFSENGLSFYAPTELTTGYYDITFYHSEDQEVVLEDIPYIDGDFINVLDFDNYPIDGDEIRFDPDPITAIQEYITDPALQPSFPPNSQAYYNVVHEGLTNSSVSDFRLNDIPGNEQPLSTVLNDGEFNNTPYLHFWYKSDGVSSIKIYMGGQRRELEDDYRSTNGEWILVAVNLKNFISTASDLSTQLDIRIQPTSSGAEIKEQSLDWFIITDSVLTEFDAEDWSSDQYWAEEG